MAETFVPLAAGFSTADAERPEVVFREGELSVRFNDWREQPVVLRFADAVAFRWQDAAALPGHVRDDGSYEVTDSAWIAELGRSTRCHGSHITTCFASMPPVCWRSFRGCSPSRHDDLHAVGGTMSILADVRVERRTVAARRQTISSAEPEPINDPGDMAMRYMMFTKHSDVLRLIGKHGKKVIMDGRARLLRSGAAHGTLSIRRRTIVEPTFGSPT